MVVVIVCVCVCVCNVFPRGVMSMIYGRIQLVLKNKWNWFRRRSTGFTLTDWLIHNYSPMADNGLSHALIHFHSFRFLSLVWLVFDIVVVMMMMMMVMVELRLAHYHSKWSAIVVDARGCIELILPLKFWTTSTLLLLLMLMLGDCAIGEAKAWIELIIEQ